MTNPIAGGRMLARVPQGGGRKDQALLAYEAIAPVYDAFTSYNDYDLWLGNLMPKLEAHGLKGNRLLDVACGTGLSFIPMLEKGWEVTACDLSPAMVQLAKKKVGRGARVSVADMRALPVFGEFDLVWCLDDAVNYLGDATDLRTALVGMRRNLAPGGLLIFDLNTIEVFRTFFAEEVIEERDGYRFTWRGISSPELESGGVGEAVFEAEPFEPSGSAVPAAVHRERHFPESVVLDALKRAGLECLDVFGHHHDAVLRQPLDETAHTKAIYISRIARGQSNRASSPS
jgi:SAM-dependent methyltransferase